MYSKLHEKKSCDYVLIISMEKYAKCGHQVQKQLIQTVRSVKTTAYDQNNNMQWYLHIFKAQKSSKSG